MKSKKILRDTIVEAMIISFLLATSFVNIEDPGITTLSGITTILYNLFNGFYTVLSGKSGIISIDLIILFIALLKIKENEKYNVILKKPYLGVSLLSILFTIGKAYRSSNTMEIMWNSSFHLLQFALYLLGYFFIFTELIHLAPMLNSFFESLNFNKYSKLYNSKHFFLITWGCILLFWLPNIIIKYPGALTPDNWGQLTQYNGMFPMYSHWPPFHTVLLGFFVYTGEKIVSTTFGLFCYVLTQYIIMSLIMAYSVSVIKELSSSKWFTLLSTVVCCISPFYLGYISVAEKDVFFAGFFTLYILELIQLVRNRQLSAKHIALLVIAETFTALFRKNGIYAVIISTVIFTIYFIVVGLKNKNKFYIAMILAVVVPIFLYIGINNSIIAAYNVQSGHIREALSIPIQQTARYISYYHDEVTEDEWKVLNATFEDCDSMGNNYNGEISDDVKDRMYDDISKEQLADYLKVWGKMFFKHPMVYFDATLYQNRYFFDVNLDNIRYYRDFHMNGDDRIEFDEVEALQGWSDTANIFYEMLQEFPLFGVFSNLAFVTLLLLLMLFYELRNHKLKTVMLMLPVIVVILTLIAGPCIWSQPRYLLAINYSLPVLIALFISEHKDKVK